MYLTNATTDIVFSFKANFQGIQNIRWQLKSKEIKNQTETQFKQKFIDLNCLTK